MGLPFASGHVLGLRRFRASSIGPGYFSVWHRDPDGRWDFYSDVDAMSSCNRFFGAAVAGFKQTEIRVSWPESHALRVEMPSEEFRWEATFRATPATRLMSAIGAVMPEPLWKSRPVLGLMGRVAGPLPGRRQAASHGLCAEPSAVHRQPKAYLGRGVKQRIAGGR